MFKLKYNLLALLLVIFGLFNYLFIINIFGVSSLSDVYLLVTAIFTSLLLIQQLSIEQFLFFYNDIKAKNKEEAYNFYHAVLMVAIATGIVTYIISYAGQEYILNLFVGSIDTERYKMIKELFIIASIELIFSPIWVLNQKLMNAEMKFSWPYILNIIPVFSTFLALIYIYYENSQDIYIVLYARVISSFVTTIGSLYILHKMGIPIKIKYAHPELKKFVKNSFTMRFGHNIHNFLFTPITTNILASLPQGNASYFYYAYRMVTILYGVVVGPSFNVFQSKLSEAWSIETFSVIKQFIYKYLIVNVPLLIVISIFGYFTFPIFLSLVASELTEENLITIKYMFIFLMFWHLIILVESGYVAVLSADKNSTIFIIGNLIFSFLYFIVANYLLADLGIYSILFGVILGQIINYFIYTSYGKKTLTKKESQNEG